jgi:hypothetical protein
MVAENGMKKNKIRLNVIAINSLPFMRPQISPVAKTKNSMKSNIYNNPHVKLHNIGLNTHSIFVVDLHLEINTFILNSAGTIPWSVHDDIILPFRLR